MIYTSFQGCTYPALSHHARGKGFLWGRWASFFLSLPFFLIVSIKQKLKSCKTSVANCIFQSCGCKIWVQGYSRGVMAFLKQKVILWGWGVSISSQHPLSLKKCSGIKITDLTVHCHLWWDTPSLAFGLLSKPETKTLNQYSDISEVMVGL